MARPRTKRKDLPPGLYWDDRRGFYFRRGKYVGIGKVDREKAIKAWVKITNRAELETKGGTFGELIDLFLREALPLVGSPKTRTEYERQCNKLRERWGAMPYGVTDSDAVQRKCLRTVEFSKYLRTVEKVGNGSIQANHDVKLVHRIFVVAKEHGLTEHNAAAGVRYIAEAPRKRPVTQADRDAIAANAAPVFRLMMRITEATGMRLTDVRRLRVQQVHDGIIDLSQSKTKNAQHWEITPAVQAILDEAATLPGRAVSMYVFPKRNGTPYTEQGVHHMRRRALALAGLKDLQFRDIRKAAINEAKRQGMNAQEFAGHADPRTTAKHYLNGPVKVRPTR
jgi:integrase